MQVFAPAIVPCVWRGKTNRLLVRAACMPSGDSRRREGTDVWVLGGAFALRGETGELPQRPYVSLGFKLSRGYTSVCFESLWALTRYRGAGVCLFRTAAFTVHAFTVIELHLHSRFHTGFLYRNHSLPGLSLHSHQRPGLLAFAHTALPSPGQLQDPRGRWQSHLNSFPGPSTIPPPQKPGPRASSLTLIVSWNCSFWSSTSASCHLTDASALFSLFSCHLVLLKLPVPWTLSPLSPSRRHSPTLDGTWATILVTWSIRSVCYPLTVSYLGLI